MTISKNTQKISRTAHSKVLWDAVIVGGGFYGAMAALHLKQLHAKVLLVEKSKELLMEASYINQARIHNGYHYPRSFLTAARSHANYARFQKDFPSTVVNNKMYYAIAKNSRVNKVQFERLCKSIGAPLQNVDIKTSGLFNKNLISTVLEVNEKVFNAGSLRKILAKRLLQSKVTLSLDNKVIKIYPRDRHLVLQTNKEVLRAKKTYLCTYAHINNLLAASGLKPLPFKYELVEMPLFRPPKEFANTGITIIDGPFFGVLPFPDQNLHTLYHVRYAVHRNSNNNRFALEKFSRKSNFVHMQKDAVRYIPSLIGIKKAKSLYTVRTVLQKDEFTDSRPILFRGNYGFKGLTVIMGGKIDNVYDVLSLIK